MGARIIVKSRELSDIVPAAAGDLLDPEAPRPLPPLEGGHWSGMFSLAGEVLLGDLRTLLPLAGSAGEGLLLLRGARLLCRALRHGDTRVKCR